MSYELRLTWLPAHIELPREVALSRPNGSMGATGASRLWRRSRWTEYLKSSRWTLRPATICVGRDVTVLSAGWMVVGEALAW